MWMFRKNSPGMKSAFKAMCKALDKDLSGRLSALHTQDCSKPVLHIHRWILIHWNFLKEEMKKPYNPEFWNCFQLPLNN